MKTDNSKIKEAAEDQKGKKSKTFSNTSASQAKESVSDLKTWGDPDAMELICKASSKEEGWMKSTKAMEIAYVGCVVQVTTQQGANVAEAAVFVPGVRIERVKDEEGKIISRRLVSVR